MKLYWIHPDRDETLTFDLPDDAKCVQVGARCPCCREQSMRTIAFVDHDAGFYRCTLRRKETPTQPGMRHERSRLRYSIRRGSGHEYVAHVNEGDAPSFIVRPVAVIPGMVRE